MKKKSKSREELRKIAENGLGGFQYHGHDVWSNPSGNFMFVDVVSPPNKADSSCIIIWGRQQNNGRIPFMHVINVHYNHFVASDLILKIVESFLMWNVSKVFVYGCRNNRLFQKELQRQATQAGRDHVIITYE